MSLLRRPEHAAAFKLHALAENFFGPLEDMIGEKEYLLGDRVTSVDCLAYGYLSLMLYPKVPQDWLAGTMKRKYKKLVEYTERMHSKLDVGTKVEDVMDLAKCTTTADVVGRRKAHGMTLPWSPPTTSRTSDVVLTTGRELLAQIPLLGSRTVIIRSNPSKPTFLGRYLPLITGSTATAVALGVYWAFTTGMLVWPHGEQVQIFGRKRLRDYGDLGAALAGISLLGQERR